MVATQERSGERAVRRFVSGFLVWCPLLRTRKEAAALRADALKARVTSLRKALLFTMAWGDFKAAPRYREEGAGRIHRGLQV